MKDKNKKDCVLESEIEKNRLKMTKKNKQTQPGSICQIYDRDHKIRIIAWKANKKNYKAQFLINLVLNDEIKKEKKIN